MSVAELVERVRPVALAGERVLPVVPALRAVLPEGLRRGSVVSVTGSTHVALQLLAAPSAAGAWIAAVGWPTLGVAAAAEVGVVVGRLALVPHVPRDRCPAVLAALLEGVDVVAVGGGVRVNEATIRRLVARAREQGTVLVVEGPATGWATDVRLGVVSRRWHGLGQGHGHLQHCDLEIASWGRGAAARERRAVVA